MSKKVTIFHPFSPPVVGISEDIVPRSHSRPHVLAMMRLAAEGYVTTMEYMTDRLLPYTASDAGVEWKFWPVSKRWSADHKKWRKQSSLLAWFRFRFNTPDVSIINMSGHLSPFSHTIAGIILQRKKKYVAMVGGVHLNLTAKAAKYYKEAHHILVHTRIQKQQMEAMPELKGCDIRVFPLGVDCNKYIPAPRVANQGVKLLYVGRITQLKRIHLAIDALELLIKSGFTDATLRIIGPQSQEAYFNHLNQLIKEKQLESSVQFEGFVEHGKIIKYYQEADLFVFPSEHESFGMVMIESMACGTPVVAIEGSGGPVDVITNGIDGIISTVEGYAQSVLDVFKTPGKLDVLKLNARKTAVEQYSLDETYRALKTSVESCLS